MKQLHIILSLLLAVCFVASCSDTETYAEQRERELNAINNFISKNNIEVISEDKFHAQGDTTYHTNGKNQYVYFSNSGVYMQIVEYGPKSNGGILAKGKSANVLVRYYERNINGDSIKTTNLDVLHVGLPDKFTVRNVSGSFIASFVYGVMKSTYGSTSVPGGWLVPLTYIRLGREKEKTDKLAEVKLIVQHDQGTAAAVTGVYACFYDMIYEEAE